MIAQVPVLVCYVPTPHRGYINFFRKYEGGELYVLGLELARDFVSLVRNLPANKPEDVCSMVRSLGIFRRVQVLDSETVWQVRQKQSLVMPDEDVSRELAEKHFTGLPVHYESIWLRWHKDAVLQGKEPEGERTISCSMLDRELMGKAISFSEKSSDWWRQVGALVVKDGGVLFGAYNKHQPSEQNPYFFGDPRSHFGPGESIEMSSALHAEIGIIALAAKRGVSLEGSSLYVSVFPCPPCANAIANAGFKKVFYAGGYSLIAGDAILKAKGIELVHVSMEDPPLL